jgi:hypothetical protein
MPGRKQRRAHMLEAIFCGMKSGTTKPINYNKVKGIIQKLGNKVLPASMKGEKHQIEPREQVLNSEKKEPCVTSSSPNGRALIQ